MFAQRFFRPIQDLSEKFNILQSRDGGVRTHFQITGRASAARIGSQRHSAGPSAKARLNSATCGSAMATSRSRRGRLGLARRLVPSGARADHRHRRTHGAGKTTLISLVAALLRHSARTNPPGRQGHSTDRIAGFAAAIRHRAAGSISFTGTIETKYRLAPRASTAPQSNAPSRRLGLENSFAPCRREWAPA